MLYIASRLFGDLAHPGALLLLCCVIGLLLFLRKRRSSRWFLVVGIGGLAAFAILPIDTWLMRPLESRFAMPDPMPVRVDGIIVLGGAVDVNRSVDRGVPILKDSAGRMTEFVALARRYPAARLVFTGGNADPFVKKATEAEIARRFFRDVGVDTRHMVFEDKARNTHENAVLTRQRMHPRLGETWLLVTTAADLPRAVGSFRSVGWTVVAVPCDYRTLRHSSGFAPGLVQSLSTTDWAVHEWIGLTYYYLRGWTPTLFPGPR